MARVHSNLEYDLWEAHLNDGDLIKAFSTSTEFSQLTTTGDVVVAATQPVDGSSVLVDDTSRGPSRTLEVSSVTPVKKVETKRYGRARVLACPGSSSCGAPTRYPNPRPHSRHVLLPLPFRRRKMGIRSISKALSYTKANRQENANHNHSVELESAAKRFDSALRAQLSTWTDKLIDLQPKVYMSPHILECGLVLFKALRQRQLQAWIDGKLPKSYISNRELMRHDLVAVWWIAMKHCSVRTAVPNRALLARATDSKRSLLSECELVRRICSLCPRRSRDLKPNRSHALNTRFSSHQSALCALEWDVQLILRTYGLIVDTDEFHNECYATK